MGNEDYWSEDFDTDQNCAERARIAELQEKVAKQVGPADWDLVDQGQTFYGLIVCWVIRVKVSIVVVGFLKHFTPNFVEVLEMHPAPFLDQLFIGAKR